MARKLSDYLPRGRLKRDDVRKFFVQAGDKGLNAIDSLPKTKPGYALVLDNFFPTDGYIELRNGFREFFNLNEGTAPVEYLFAHPMGNSQLFFACCNGKIINWTGRIKREVSTGHTSNDWVHVTYNGYTYLLNGIDTPVRLNPDGTKNDTFGFADPNGNLDVNDLHLALVYKNRIFFAEKETGTFWYTNPGEIQGDLNPYFLGQVYRDGGAITGLTSLNIDSGTGLDDIFLAFFADGNAIAYQGTDIADPYNWQSIGNYDVGRLIGRRPFLVFGSETIAITEEGFLPLSLMIGNREGNTNLEKRSISAKINPLITNLRRNSRVTEKWNAIYFPSRNQIIFNAPFAGDSIQFVVNTQTQAWCRYTGINSYHWLVGNNQDIYFGAANGIINEFNVGDLDGDKSIEAKYMSVFSFMRSPKEKNARYIKPFIEASDNIGITAGLAVDFNLEPLTLIPVEAEPTGASEWNTAEWNISEWGTPLTHADDYIPWFRTGTTFAVVLETNARLETLRIYDTEILYTMKDGHGRGEMT